MHYPSAENPKAYFELVDTFQDVINHNRWLHCQFLRLNEGAKIISQHPVNESFMGQSSLLTPQQVLNGVNQDFRNTSNEIFVGSFGESIADTLKFFNVAQPIVEGAQNTATLNNASLLTNPKFKEIKKVELQQEGIAYMSAFSGKSHLSIVMASINGSLYVWTPRPAKIIQPLAPNFVEIEDNIVYVERESEFESEMSSEEETPEEQVGDGAFGRSLIQDLTKQ